MSDDEPTEEVLDEESLDEESLDEQDVLGEGDLDAELFDDEAAVGGDDVFDDDEPDEDEEEAAESPLPLDVTEDGDDELDGQPPVDLAAIEGLEVDDPLVVAEEDDEDPNDTIREGEFVCSSCHMAKRSSALADADEMLCRDCV